jgi:hypothetical protein
MLSKSLTKHFNGFSSGFSQLHAKLDADALLDIVIHCRKKLNTKWKKWPCKNNQCAQRSVTWQTEAMGLQQCDLGFPSHLLSARQLQQ